MKIKNFEDILSCKKSQELSLVIYKIFREIKDYGFKDQIQREIINVSNNIAKGFERRSNKEFINFYI